MEAVFKPMHVRVTEQGEPDKSKVARDECKGHAPNCTGDHNLDAVKDAGNMCKSGGMVLRTLVWQRPHQQGWTRGALLITRTIGSATRRPRVRRSAVSCTGR